MNLYVNNKLHSQVKEIYIFLPGPVSLCACYNNPANIMNALVDLIEFSSEQSNSLMESDKAVFQNPKSSLSGHFMFRFKIM